VSVKELTERPGWFNVVVYERVSKKGGRPRKLQRIVKGQRAAEKEERRLLTARDAAALSASAQTLGAYARGYLASRRHEVSAQTFAGYEAIAARYILPYPIAARRLADVTVTAVRTFYGDVLENGARRRGVAIQPATVVGVHRLLSMVLKQAAAERLLHSNPCQEAKPPKDDRSLDGDDEPGVDPETARAFLVAATGMPVHAIAAVALGTGLRRSELLALRWCDVDVDAGSIDVNGKIEQVGKRVRRRAPKTKRSRRVVPFGPAVATVLRAQRALLAARKLKFPPQLWVDEPWVFPSLRVSAASGGGLLPAGRLWTPSAFAQQWRECRNAINARRLVEFVAAGGEAEDFEPWTFGIHSLRHAYATVQLAAGVRDELVSRRLGHSSSLVTRRVYSHVVDAEVRDGVDVADGLL